MRQLISKLIAAGLSAGVVLLWWPLVMSANGPSSWVLRAVVWTLLFELLLALLAPIEESIWDNINGARKLASRVNVAKARVYDRADSNRKRVASHVMVAAIVAAIPIGLIAQGPTPPVAVPVVVKKPVTKVIRITKVVRVRDDRTITKYAAAPQQSRVPVTTPGPVTKAPAQRDTAQRESSPDKQRVTTRPTDRLPSGATAPTAAPAPPPATSPPVATVPGG
ncbi:MAG TPA: hypothetical protein VGO97_03360 [Solirubrobacterales bacterium]|jgi:hypothetical protein|nr:hypothetical protein [Solirubrobacterales bacterium]